MADDSDNSNLLNLSATRAVEVTPSDNDLDETPKALYVGGAGDITMVGIDAAPAGAGVLWKNVPAGVVLPFRPRRILADGTTATNILALYNGPSTSPSASITSPASFSQPGASQRFYQATANKPGTWAISAGYTIDSATGIWSIDLANAGDGTGALLKTPTITFTPTAGGALTQLVALTLTTVEAPASASVSYVSDFTGTAATPLSSVSGWSISRTGTGPIGVPVLDGAGKIRGVPQDDQGYQREGLWAVLYSPAGGYEGSTTTFNVPNNGDATYDSIYPFAAATDYLNGVAIQLYPRNQAQSQSGFSRQAGVNTTLPGLGDMNYKPDGTLDIVFQFSADGNALTISSVGTTTFSETVDLTGKTKGNKFGFAGLGAYVPAFGPALFVNSVSYVKAETTLTVTNAPAYSVDNTATYSVAWAGVKPTRLQHRFYDESGTAMSSWMTGESTVTGTSSGTISYLATAPSIKSGLIPRFRPINDTPVIAVAATPTYFLAPAQAPEFGYNVRAPNYYIGATPMFNNWGKFFYFYNTDAYLPIDGIAGFANVQTDPGINWYGPTGGLTIVSQNNATGALRLQVTDGPSVTGRTLKYGGGDPTRFDVTRDGITADISADWIAAVEGPWLRDLDMVHANDVPQNGTLGRTLPSENFYTRNDGGVGPEVPYQRIVDAVAAKAAADPTFKGYWSVLGNDLTGADVTARATYQRDHLPATLKIAVELGNEQWNGQFSGMMRNQIDGIRNGWYGAGTTYATKQANVNVSFEGEGPPGSTAGVSGRTTNAIAAGDYIMFNVYSVGYAIYRAKQAAPAGTFVASGTQGAVTENAYFTLDADKNQEVAGRRWRTVHHDQIIEIYRAVFGEARFQSQIVPVVMGRQPDNSPNADLYNQLVIERTFVPGYWAKVKGAGMSFYINSDGRGLDPDTVTEAQFDVAFRHNFTNYYQGAIKQMVGDCFKMGVTPYLYEGGPGPLFATWQSNAHYKATYDSYLAGTLGRAFMSDYAFFNKSNIPGVCMIYDLMGAPPWSMKKSQQDLNNGRRLGWLDGLARTS